MFTHNLLPPIELTQINTAHGRFYCFPNGKSYPSMTTILNFEPKPEIEEWKKRVGLEEADKVSKRACKRGQILHGYAEEYLKNSVPDVSMFDIQAWNAFRPVLDRVNNIRLIEGRLYSDRLKISGTADLIGDWDNVLSTIDLKTSLRLKTEEEIESYFLQTAGYSCMVYERYGLKIQKLVILISVDNEEPQIFVKDVGDYLDPLFKKISSYYAFIKSQS